MASVPVASIWWIGLKRPPNRPVCGPLLSSGMPSANTLPVRIRPAALMMSSGRTWLSVPIWSSLPQRPQFLSFSVAAAIACLPTLMSITCSFSSLYFSRSASSCSDPILTRHAISVHAKALDPAKRAQDPSRCERHVGERCGAERAERVVDGVHDSAGRASGAGLARALGAQFGIGGRSDHMADLDVGHLGGHRHEVVGHVAVG